MEQIYYWVWICSVLNISRLRIARLLDRFGSIDRVYKARREEYYNIEGLTRAEADRLCSKDLTQARAIVARCMEKSIDILVYGDPRFPERLASIDDVPYVLYVRGELPPVDRCACIAVVGSRTASEYGMTAAGRISRDLAQYGAVVVTGIARGIDTAAAKGALEAGGRVIAVLGCGVDVAYPPENAGLMERIAKSGAVISEYAPGSAAIASHFPVRNRIISGLSVAALVVEAGTRSGALITANHALEQGRDVFAVPGSIFDRGSEGCNALIKSGARLCDRAGDIIEEYRGFYGFLRIAPKKADERDGDGKRPALSGAAPAEGGADKGVPRGGAASAPRPAPDFFSENEKRIYELLSKGEGGIDEIARQLSMPAAAVMSALTDMELAGYVRQTAGRRAELI